MRFTSCFQSTVICAFSQLVDSVPVQEAIAVQKDSEFKPMFDYYLYKLKETGTLHELYNEWDPHFTQQSQRDGYKIGQSADVLGYNNLAFPFILMATGLVASFGIVLAEWLVKRLKGVVRNDTNQSQDHAQTFFLP